jgi:DNA-binding NarL/FixJ family response regulator
VGPLQPDPSSPFGHDRRLAVALARSEARLVGLIVGDQIIRRRLAVLLAECGLSPCVQASDAAHLMESARLDLDAVVLAWSSFGSAEADDVRLVRARFPGATLILVSPEAHRRAVLAGLDAGADGFVREEEARPTLPLALAAASAGHLVLPREFRAPDRRPLLSPRERQVLSMVVMGFTNGEIAARLHVAESTVKSHLTSAYAKLDVRSRTEATALILDPERGLGMGILAITPADELRAAHVSV